MILEDLKIDWIKYETLLEKSLIKYKDHILIDNTYQHYDYFNKEYYEQQR